MAPLALYETVANANRIAAVCERAEAGGVSPGVGLAEARARFPGLAIILADPPADARLLTALADWCDRYTPLVALDPPHGLFLDISGCAHLFGGEKALMDNLLARLFQQGFAASAAIASHAGTALALVGPGATSIIAAGAEQAAIAPLPVAALRLDATLTAMLRRLGLKTVGSLLSLPRAGLARRFGEDLLTRLDEAAGRVFRPIRPRRPIPELAAERRLFEPISRIEDVERVLFLLAERLRDDLARRGVGARRLELSLFRVDGQVNRLAVGASRPVREPGHVQRLFRERMKGLGEEFDAGYGYDLVKLAVFEAAPMPDVQTDLSGADAAVDAFGGLIDRLGARLGEASVLRIEAADSHWPERAECWRPVGAGNVGPLAARQSPAPAGAPRPVRLLALPEPIEASFEVPDGAPLQFRWRRALHLVRRAEGPERIGAEWWRDAGEAARDYYRIEDADGRRFWLFRAGWADPAVDPEWQLPAPRPAWYLHGIFA
ncbi:DNA polymerase Y family protein [Aurantimonas sp. C2-6-R+9]|uniref:DNA polymerase Y family protein n=1 Tax=unclassified Aurantimonas TaxID=2638230 RepID=UPI002E18AAA4|nr:MULTISPECIES: DNA polymerase Y family protein [unclassified Aurantimonas]MEC5291416.1 DNA polymerase Y family protein [Aurantimonas sp. C2-3-R2]MEC5381128.1 DNA polymerase Y family protein [Aurantimonas sp. C2-6-R+9]MEC5412468.1 DNA polymerase Y family protein [Aurantimonas sp. C2-4-R8]